MGVGGGYRAAKRKKEILPFVAAWLDLEGEMLGEIGRQCGI